jgi:hypothetical protein
MRTFKQYLNALEKQRKLEKTSLPKDNMMPVYVHGKHAAKSTNNSFPNYVHGKHASNKINEEADTGAEPTDLRDWFDNHNKNVNGGQGIDSLHAELTNHYHEDLSNHPDSNHVVDYTKGSSELNGALLRSHRSGASDIESVDDGYNYMSEKSAEMHNERRNGIDKAISSIPAPKDFDTYAGVGFDPRRLMDQNGVVHSPAYLSSSIDPRIAHSFSHELDSRTGQSPRDNDGEIEKHILKIPVKQYQTNGVYVDSISNFGTKEGQLGEKEFLHPRGQKYKIDPTPKTLTSKYGGSTHIWTANPIED